MRKELEQLIFEGELYDSIEIMGKTWTLKTIGISNNQEFIKRINTNNEALNVMILKVECVSRALVSIDDIVLDDLKEKQEFINKLPFQIVDKLFKVYDGLMVKLNKSLEEEEIEEIKNSQKTVSA